jgi:hypothetical protein
MHGLILPLPDDQILRAAVQGTLGCTEPHEPAMAADPVSREADIRLTTGVKV